MSEAQRPTTRVFKQYEVVKADCAEQIGRSVTAMLTLGMGWQLYGPTMCVATATGLEYYQAMMLYEYVQDPLPGESENANDTPSH